jgi:tRNA-uridine 2-sulfurtransferase
MKKPIAVALSGGIDSLMAANLLKKDGNDVIGVHFITGFENNNPASNLADSTGDTPDFAILKKEASTRMDHVASQLDITIDIIDLRKPFKEKVVDYFSRTYLRGQTPNPCLICNPQIKFGILFEHARGLGADMMATGHYARIEPENNFAQKGQRHLLAGIDKSKDQSYFLAFLSQAQLSKACFPLGKSLKTDIKKEAAQLGLTPAVKTESQDICFINKGAYAEFIANIRGFDNDVKGPIVDLDGKFLGQHTGLYRFTVGQRRGINCPATQPYYVLRIDTQNNRLVVGFKEQLESSSCNVHHINWIQKAPLAPTDFDVRIRYRHQATPAKIYPLDDTRVKVHFKKPQSAVTPGQGAVFYREDEVVGGGFIVPEKTR